MSDSAVLRARLAKLEAARDACLTGTQVEGAGGAGESVTFGKVDLGRLQVEIEQLRMQLGERSASPFRVGL